MTTGPVRSEIVEAIDEMMDAARAAGVGPIDCPCPSFRQDEPFGEPWSQGMHRFAPPAAAAVSPTVGPPAPHPPHAIDERPDIGEPT